LPLLRLSFGDGVSLVTLTTKNAWLVVASKAGADTNPASGAARVAALKGVAAISPQYGEYQERTDREIPIIRLTPDQG
jgi:hypothetical protein